jgi:hypothetical protein
MDDVTKDFVAYYAQDIKKWSDSDYNISQKINELISAQEFNLISKQIFNREAQLIKKACELNDLFNIVDIGCWTGVLAAEIFNTGLIIKNYHLVDAVPYYMQRALIALEGKPVTSELVTLLPMSYKQEPPTSFLIHPYDTLNTSSIYSSYFLHEEIKQANVKLPLAPSSYVDKYVSDNISRFNNDTYVKIDIDGVDQGLVFQMLKNKVQPGALQFESWNQFKSDSEKLLSSYKNYFGYKIPDFSLNHHQAYTVCISKNYWWAVGYDNLMIKPQATYYDLEHGIKPF